MMLRSTAAPRAIPVDILWSILKRIPASSLQRLKLVNKQWFHITSDPKFVQAHLVHQSLEEFGWSLFKNTTKCVLFMEGTSSPTPNPPQRIKLPGAGGVTCVLGSCQGLVLYSTYSFTLNRVKLRVANPVTRENVIIPPFEGYTGSHFRSSSLGFIWSASLGFVCNTGEIKVVLVAEQRRHTLFAPFICAILTLGSSSWRQIMTPIPGERLKGPYVPPLFIKGALHWCYDTGILSLDLGRLVFHQTEVTFCSSRTLKHKAEYIAWDGCYAVLLPHEQPLSTCTVWILRESGWTKFDIDNAFFERQGCPISEDGPNFSTTMRNGEILLFYQSAEDKIRALSYDLGRQVMTKFAQFDKKPFLNCQQLGRRTGFDHVNSLVSLASFFSGSAPTHAPSKRILFVTKSVISLLSKRSAYL